MKIKLLITAGIFLGSSMACATFRSYDPLPTAKKVSVKRYVGKWYAVTSLPLRFSRDCVAQTADYDLISPTKIGVLNTCIKKNGETRTIEGAAKVTDVSGVLDLKFDTWWANLFNITADYNIIKLDSRYRYALIGGKNRKSLWLLSRTKSVSDKVYDEYIGLAEDLGYNVDKLVDSKF